jgi:glycosyltransferase involved in cell wall biosynthesis
MKMMKAKVSIIVPVYNVERYLRRCVDSILAQKFRDYELILVNDGSTDDGGKLCDEYAEQHFNVRVIHKSNGGLSSARNAGLEIADSEYIAFVDSDDYIHPEMIGTLHELARANSSDVAMCHYVRTSEDLISHEFGSAATEVSHFTNIQAINELLRVDEDHQNGKRNGLHWVLAWNKLYKRQLFDGLRYKDGVLFEDIHIIHRLLYKCSKITYIPKPLYYYYQRPESIVNSSFTMRKADKVYALEDRAIFLRSAGETQLYRRALKTYLDVFYWYYYRAVRECGHEKEQIAKLKRSLRKWLLQLLANPLISWKQRLFLLLFVLRE